MPKTSRSTKNATPSPLSPLSSVSRDAGALELGVESAWTRDDTFVARVEPSDSSQRAEPPTSDLLSASVVEGALGAPVDSSPPLVSVDGNDLEKENLPIGDE